MPGVRGKLKPFRITRDEFINLIEMVVKKSKIERIDVDMGRFSSRSVNIKGFKDFSSDLRLPTAVSDVDLWLWGTPNINFSFSKDEARYTIIGADTLDQATLIEQIIQNFFRKHAINSLFSPLLWFFLCFPSC